jgi:hypothetical protein
MRIHSDRLLVGIVLFLTACPCGVRAQDPACAKELAMLSPTEPVYPDAMELKRTLESQGFVVHCMFPTTLWSVLRSRTAASCTAPLKVRLITTPTMGTRRLSSCRNPRLLPTSRSRNIVRMAAFSTPLPARLGCGRRTDSGAPGGFTFWITPTSCFSSEMLRFCNALKKF